MNLSTDSLQPINAGLQDLHLSGHEPKFFPGVLSRPQRRDGGEGRPGTERSEKGWEVPVEEEREDEAGSEEWA